MNILKWLCICWACIQCTSASTNLFTYSKIQFIKNVCLRENRPTAVYSFLCWNREQKKSFIKSISGLRTVQGVSVENVDTNKLFYPIPPHRALFVVDLQCEDSMMFLEQADRLGLFISPYRWIIFSDIHAFDNDAKIDPESMNLLNSVGIYADSEILFLKSVLNQKFIQFEIYQPYKIAENMSIIAEYYGQWTNNYTFVDKRTTLIISRRRRNFQQNKLRVGLVILDNNTINNLGTYKTPHIDTLTKAHYLLTQIILQFFNFSGEYIISDSLGGPVYFTSKPKGLYKLILDRQTDIGSDFFMMPARMTVKFIAPSSLIHVKILFRQPRLSYVENLFTLTFANPTWIAIAILTAITLITLAAALFFEEKRKVCVQTQNVNYLHSHVSDVMLVMIATVCQQGTEAEPSSNSGKIVLLMLLVSLTFFYNAYTANIVVILQSTSDGIRTITDLANSKLVFGVERFYFRSYFDNITNPERLYLANQKIKGVPENNTFITVYEGIQRLRNEPFSFLTLPTVAYHLVEKYFFEYEKCDIQEIPFVDSTNGWIITSHNSSFVESLKVGYQTLYETGHTTRIWKQFFLQKPSCTNKQNYFTSAGIEDLNFAFKLFIVGVAISIGLFIVEHIRYRLLKRKTNKIYKN